MAFCRSRKTGNCSDCSQNKLLQEKPPETFPESFLISGSSVLCVGRGGIACTYGNREAPAWPRRGKSFLELCMRLPGRDGTGRTGTEWQRVRNGDSAKAGVPSRGVPSDEPRSDL